MKARFRFERLEGHLILMDHGGSEPTEIGAVMRDEEPGAAFPRYASIGLLSASFARLAAAKAWLLQQAERGVQ